MAEEAKDESQPFAEKYKAREILQNLRQSPYLADKFTRIVEHTQEEVLSDSQVSENQGSDVMRCALGLLMYKLGSNYYETEEGKEALACFKKSFELMDTLPNGLKLRHLNTIQDLYNHIAIITSDRGGANDQEDELKNREALEYLNKAQEIYEIVKQHTIDLPQKSIMNNFDNFILKQSKNKTSTHFSFYINQGLDLKLLETKYTTTLFVMAQIHQKLNNIEEGMKYCAITMKRQLEAKEYQLKDWCINALTLSEAYLSREHFAQAEYLLYAAYNLIPDKDEGEI